MAMVATSSLVSQPRQPGCGSGSGCPLLSCSSSAAGACGCEASTAVTNPMTVLWAAAVRRTTDCPRHHVCIDICMLSFGI